jgi:hypothetical protein
MNLKQIGKTVSIMAVAILLNVNTYASIGKLAEVLVMDSGVADIFSKRAIDREVALSVKTYVNNALIALGKNNQKPDAAQLLKTIESMRIDKAKYPEDYAKKMELIGLLNKNADDIGEQELKDAINNLIYLANRRGSKSLSMISCAQCVNEQLANNGFLYTFDVVAKNKTMSNIITSLPADPRARLVNIIKPGLRKIGGSKNYMGLVEPSEDKALSLFIKVLDRGTAKQKKLAQAILDVSKDSKGKVLLLDRKNQHKLWKLFVEDMNDDVMDGWINILEKTAKKTESGMSSKDAFHSTLEEIAGESEELKKHFDYIKSNNCYFL